MKWCDWEHYANDLKDPRDQGLQKAKEGLGRPRESRGSGPRGLDGLESPGPGRSSYPENPGAQGVPGIQSTDLHRSSPYIFIHFEHIFVLSSIKPSLAEYKFSRLFSTSLQTSI